MTNDSLIHDGPHDGGPSGVADSELETLLSDAYGAPAMPRSLLKRIDRAIEAEWGVSPALTDNRLSRLPKTVSHGTRWVRAVPVAAAAALVVVFAVVFSGDGRAFAWSTMLDALTTQGVIERQTADDSRWLSLADGVISERTADASRLLNLREGVALEHRQGGAEIERRRLASRNASGRDGMMLGFLLADGLSTSEWNKYRTARVIDDSWESVTSGDTEQIMLHLQFETENDERGTLSVTLDPQTHLPISLNVPHTGTTAASLALSYPKIDVADLRQRDFPADLPIVDVSDEAGLIKTVPSEDLPPATAAVTPVNIKHAPIEEADVSESTLLGAASTWKPVVVKHRSTDEVIDRVDALLAELWSQNGIQPAPAANDTELLRRVYLDIAGRTPTVNEVRAYLKDTSDDRYQELVDRLLNSPDHASHLAAVWRTFLIPEGVDLTAFGGIEAFDQWLADRFNSNDSYDDVVRSLLLAEGRLSRSGPLLFYSATKLDPEQLAARTARVFLGMRLECAQCHDHPFEPWSQEDFWSYAAFFTQISRPQGELENVSSVMRVHDVDRGEATLPDTDVVVPPRFLDGSEFTPDDKQAARRQQLARWLTSAENPYFARATANRVWGQMFGKGIVDPIDDFGVLNEPRSPELLDLMAGHFIGTDFNLREVFRTVALSRAYQLSSGAPTVDDRRIKWFAQMNIKTLTAEQVYDCITVATMLDGDNAGDFNITRFGNSERELFLQQFRTPAGRSTEYHGGIPQSLTLMNGSLIQGATGLSSSGLLKSLEAPFFTNEQRIEVLYFATLSRPPRPAEWELLRNYVPDDANGAALKEGLADLLWALLNSAEFTMNH